MLRQTILVALAIVGCASVERASADGSEQRAVFDTPEQLWRGFDPERPDLEIESLNRWTEGKISLEKLKFTAEQAEGGRVRVFALRGSPAQGARLPGILHIHGGGQTASLDWVRFWAKRGYVCVSFDFTGPWAGRKEFTDWGPITQGNLAKAQGGLLVRPTPRASTWYHWAVACRRALTLLSYHPKVDRERLGIFGVSVGGTLCWLVAGTDERVKTVLPIYGCGYNYDPRKMKIDPDTALFNRVLAPEAYAASIRAPVLLLDATNDFHGWMDDAYRALAQTHVTNRIAFTPRYDHHIDGVQGADLPAWMDWQLRGKTPFPEETKLELRLGADRDPLAVLHPDDASHVAGIDVFYSLGDKLPPHRFWRRADVRQVGSGWEAALPVFDTNQALMAFANVRYRSDICLSTNLVKTTPRRLRDAQARLKWNASPRTEGEEPGFPFVMAAANTDPNVSPVYFVRSTDPNAPNAVCFNPKLLGRRTAFHILSRYIGDPAYEGRPGMALAFECSGDFLEGKESNRPVDAAKAEVLPAGITVEVAPGAHSPHRGKYVAHVQTQRAEQGWQTVRLALSQFRGAKNRPLTSWSGLDQIELLGVTSNERPASFANFRWVEESAGK